MLLKQCCNLLVGYILLQVWDRISLKLNPECLRERRFTGEDLDHQPHTQTPLILEGSLL